MMPVSTPALELVDLSKSFGATQALSEARLQVLPGEIHGLLGENGSGKSTLIKVLAGYYAPDGGRLRIYGEDVSLPVAESATRALGMAFVHQDLALIPSLSVVENLMSTDLASTTSWRISWRRARAHARRLFADYGVDIDVRVNVGELTPVERALVAIVRAMEDVRASDRPGLIVLDEPTVFLPRTETERLFALLREHVRQGGSALFVSHDLDEVREITDSVTVLRDGRVAAHAATASLSRDELIEQIVGHRVEAVSHRASAEESAVVVSVREVVGVRVRGFSLEARAGEVVGLAGLPGSGFDDVPYLLFGAQPASGQLLIDGQVTLDLNRLQPHRACAARVALIPADRKGAGSVASLSVAANMTSQTLDSYRRGPMIDPGAIRRDADGIAERFDVRPRATDVPFGSLSGGNQQKALLGKWLQARPRLLLLHEPTQGVDVGAREQIWTMIRHRAREDAQATLCASSDHEQLERLCDRVLVFHDGVVVASLAGDDVSKERISEACYGR